MAVKKAPAKSTKSAAKKVSKSKGTRTLVYAPGHECFWTTDGQVLANLLDLRDALKTMKDDVFAHHVNKEKNDFASWVEHVLQDAELAMLMRKSRKALTTRELVVRRLKSYNI